jgi:hypothetical protein
LNGTTVTVMGLGPMRAGPIEIFHNGTITRDSCIEPAVLDNSH